MFFYLCEVLFSGFLQFKGNFVDAQNYSEYPDWAPSMGAGGTNQPSIVTQLLGTVHRITRAIDQGSQTDVSHAYLIGKLTNLE